MDRVRGVRDGRGGVLDRARGVKGGAGAMISRKCPKCDETYFSANTKPWVCECEDRVLLDEQFDIPLPQKEREGSYREYL